MPASRPEQESGGRGELVPKAAPPTSGRQASLIPDAWRLVGAFTRDDPRPRSRLRHPGAHLPMGEQVLTWRPCQGSPGRPAPAPLLPHFAVKRGWAVGLGSGSSQGGGRGQVRMRPKAPAGAPGDAVSHPQGTAPHLWKEPAPACPAAQPWLWPVHLPPLASTLHMALLGCPSEQGREPQASSLRGRGGE